MRSSRIIILCLSILFVISITLKFERYYAVVQTSGPQTTIAETLVRLMTASGLTYEDTHDFGRKTGIYQITAYSSNSCLDGILFTMPIYNDGSGETVFTMLAKDFNQPVFYYYLGKRYDYYPYGRIAYERAKITLLKNLGFKIKPYPINIPVAVMELGSCQLQKQINWLRT